MSKFTQKQRFYNFLLSNPTSCSHAAAMLQIPQKTLCRRKREFEKNGRLCVVGFVRCPITGRMVQKITTDESQFINHQLKLPFHD
jgi:hypothetical protein